MAQQYRLIKVNTDSGDSPQVSSAADIYAATSKPSMISVNSSAPEPGEGDLLGGEEPSDDFVMPELTSALDRAAKEKSEGKGKGKGAAASKDAAPAMKPAKATKKSDDFDTPMGGMRIAIMGASGLAVLAMVLYCMGVIG